MFKFKFLWSHNSSLDTFMKWNPLYNELFYLLCLCWELRTFNFLAEWQNNPRLLGSPRRRSKHILKCILPSNNTVHVYLLVLCYYYLSSVLQWRHSDRLPSYLIQKSERSIERFFFRERLQYIPSSLIPFSLLFFFFGSPAPSQNLHHGECWTASITMFALMAQWKPLHGVSFYYLRIAVVESLRWGGDPHRFEAPMHIIGCLYIFTCVLVHILRRQF